MMELQLSSLISAAPLTILQKQQQVDLKPKKINKQTLKELRENQVVIWSNSKLLEMLTISQLDCMRLQSLQHYNYKPSIKSLRDEISEFMLPFNRIIKERNLMVRSKILEGMSEETKFCLDWRVYKSILYHIMQNAIKFSNNQGKIAIEIQYEDSNLVLPDDDSFETPGDHANSHDLIVGILTTIVVDNGVGMN